MRTAQHIEEASEKSSSNKSPRRRTAAGRAAQSEAGKKYGIKNLKPWKPGCPSPNPGGRPKNDLAKEIAQAIFENDAAAIYQAYAKALRNGNAYAFTVLADRAFGKLKEKIEHTGDEELLAALAAGRKRIGDSTPTA
jgi:hypothetical protein